MHPSFRTKREKLATREDEIVSEARAAIIHQLPAWKQ